MSRRTILLVGDTIHIVLTICIISHVIHDLQRENLFLEDKDAFVTQIVRHLLYILKYFNIICFIQYVIIIT